MVKCKGGCSDMDFVSFLKRSGEVNEWRYCLVGVGGL